MDNLTWFAEFLLGFFCIITPIAFIVFLAFYAKGFKY